MRQNYIFLLFALVLLAAFTSCDNDDGIQGGPPELEAISSEIIAAPGEEIRFEGTLVDENGITEVHLVNDELLLDKRIVFARPAKKYYLDYKFLIEEGSSEKIYEVGLHINNLASKTQSWAVMVDVASSPTASGLPTQIEASPGEEITITGTISDNNGLSTLSADAETLGISDDLSLSDNPKSYELNYSFTVPLDAEKRVHKFTITAESIANRRSDFVIDINLSGEDIVYENIYAAGGFQWTPWDASLAYVMDEDTENIGWFTTELPSWDGGFDEVKFLGQLDWAPDNWGLVDASDPSQGMINDENSAAIVMPANGKNPAYYQVRFNPYILEYEISEMTEAKTPRDEMYIVGKGFTDYPDLNWNPEEAIPMTKNPYDYGEHIFLVEGLQFSDAVDIKFIGQNTGWGPYDAGFVVGGEMTAPVSWAKIQEGDGSADMKFVDQAGSYTVLFDYYLGRALIWKE